MKIRQATRDDFIQLYGAAPPRSVYALVGEQDDGSIAGIGGVYFDRVHIAFCDLRVDPKHYPISMMKAAKRIMSEVRRRQSMVMATPDNPETAVRFLEHLGFTHYRGEWFRWTQ